MVMDVLLKDLLFEVDELERRVDNSRVENDSRFFST